jgi:hypothetical protein
MLPVISRYRRCLVLVLFLILVLALILLRMVVLLVLVLLRMVVLLVLVLLPAAAENRPRGHAHGWHRAAAAFGSALKSNAATAGLPKGRTHTRP